MRIDDFMQITCSILLNPFFTTDGFIRNVSLYPRLSAENQAIPPQKKRDHLTIVSDPVINPLISLLFELIRVGPLTSSLTIPIAIGV